MTFHIIYRGKLIDVLGPHWGFRNCAEARARYLKLHPEMNPDRLVALNQTGQL